MHSPKLQISLLRFKLIDLFAIIHSIHSEGVAIYIHTFRGHLILLWPLSNQWLVLTLADCSVWLPFLSSVGCPLLVGMVSAYFHTSPWVEQSAQRGRTENLEAHYELRPSLANSSVTQGMFPPVKWGEKKTNIFGLLWKLSELFH